MKRIIYFVICLILILCVSGCNRKASDVDLSESTSATTTTETKESITQTGVVTTVSTDADQSNANNKANVQSQNGESGVEPERQATDQYYVDKNSSAVKDSNNNTNDTISDSNSNSDNVEMYTYSDGTPNLDVSSWTGSVNGDNADALDVVDPVVDNDSISEELGVDTESQVAEDEKETKTVDKGMPVADREQETDKAETTSNEGNANKSNEGVYQLPVAP